MCLTCGISIGIVSIRSNVSRSLMWQRPMLIRSFESHVELDANGDPQKIEFVYLYYGIFPDLGVGTGVTKEETPKGNRHPKPWYNKVFWARLQYIRDYVGEKYGRDAAEMVKTILTSNDKT